MMLLTSTLVVDPAVTWTCQTFLNFELPRKRSCDPERFRNLLSSEKIEGKSLKWNVTVGRIDRFSCLLDWV